MGNVDKNKQVVKIVNEPDLDYQVKIYSRNAKIVDDSWDFRNIPNKRMPFKNSPSNIVGRTASTMKNEYIVIMAKN